MMDRNIRYQLLRNEEGDATADFTEVEIVAVLPPPEYEETVSAAACASESGASNMTAHPAAPPSYKVATELPSYDEAERSKQAEAETAPVVVPQAELGQCHRESARENFTPGISLGTDCIFLCTFALSFLFNWVGFFISLCLSNTVAGRCGALAGLGLSIVKWAAILQHSDWMSDYVSASDNWIWWMLMFCGFVVFFRGCIQYFQIKYEWKKLTGQVLTLRWFN